MKSLPFDSVVTVPPPFAVESTRTVVLASASATRRRLLAAAGIEAASEVAGVDEAEIKRSLQGDGAGPPDLATALAELKALRVSRGRPDALVIGADQVLVAGDVVFDKPADRAQARAQLAALRGREHRLLSAVAIALDNVVIWRHLEEARLSMRNFDDAFLEAYLDAVGDDAFTSVGAYRLEALGAQLFTAVRGDYFTVLGLPLLPLLAFLREHRVGLAPC